MPELPVRPDINQLRHQARELLRAAARGEPDALSRLRAVSDRVVLSVAQLAVAREYGFPSWPALKAEVERRRSADLGAKPPVPAAAGPDPLEAPERWSFGGGAAIETADGTLFPELLVAGPGNAVLEASLVGQAPAPPLRLAALRRWRTSRKGRAAALRREVRTRLPNFENITATDDRGTTYWVKVAGFIGSSPAEQAPAWASFRFEPPPAPEAAWIELRDRERPTTRLVRSPRAAAHVSEITSVPVAERELADLAHWLIEIRLADSPADMQGECADALARAAQIRESGELDAASELPDQLARLCATLTGVRPAGDLPASWSGMLAAANLRDGPDRHLDIAATLPALSGVATKLDSLYSGPDGWALHLRAMPGWFQYSGDRSRKWTPVSVSAEDDLGGGYISRYGGGISRPGHEEHALRFLPRLDPRARGVTLAFRAGGEEVVVTLDLLSPPGTG